METPKTFQQAIIYFAKTESCNKFMIAARWADGKVRCPQCDSDTVKYLESTRLWKCYAKHPRQKFSLKVGTIFEDSALGLNTWLTAMWLIANAKNGISSYEIHRALGITQKSAWFVLHRIRLAMQNGTVEVDETFIGGLNKNRHANKRIHRGPGPAGNVGVIGLLKRKGGLRTQVVANVDIETLQGHVEQHVEYGANVYTDQWSGYKNLHELYNHGTVNQTYRYVDGDIHTTNMENFWSLLKRSIKSTYVSVEPFHLFRYVDEQSFRFNTRKVNDSDRFAQLVQRVAGKWIQYKQLIGQPSC